MAAGREGRPDAHALARPERRLGGNDPAPFWRAVDPVVIEGAWTPIVEFVAIGRCAWEAGSERSVVPPIEGS